MFMDCDKDALYALGNLDEYDGMNLKKKKILIVYGSNAICNKTTGELLKENRMTK